MSTSKTSKTDAVREWAKRNHPSSSIVITPADRYPLVPLAALERAQGELKTAYVRIARLQLELLAYQETAAPVPAPESPAVVTGRCVCGHTKEAHEYRGAPACCMCKCNGYQLTE